MRYFCTTKRRGSILVFSLIILSLIMAAALGMAQVTLIEQRNAVVSKNSSIAFQTADAGVEVFLEELYKNVNPLDTMGNLASDLGGYRCDGGRIKPDDASVLQFEIVAYQRPVGAAITGAEVTDCNTPQLADVAEFKVIGEYVDAARALRLTLKNSLERGLVARWSFEDNADAIAYNQNYPGSPTVKDYAGNGYIMTPCPLDNGDHGLNGGSGDESFDFCHHYTGGDSHVLGDTTDTHNLFNAIWMDHGSDPQDPYRGSIWGKQGDTEGYKKLSGIVDESASIPDDAAWDVPYGQALYFNGTSNYVVMNTSKSGRVNYVENGDTALEEKIKDGFAISLWVKPEKTGGDQTLISYRASWNSALGPAIFLRGPSNRVYAAAAQGSQDRRLRSSSGIGTGSWHYIVFMWGGDGNRLELYVDGVLVDSHSMNNSPLKSGNPSLWPFMVGGRYNLKDGDQAFDAGEFQDGFQGYIDDIRIYDRGLTTNEITRLWCQQKGSASLSECQ